MYMSLIRHHESGRPDALFRDPFAEVVTTRLAGTPELAELATGLGADIPSLARRLDGAEFAYFPVRTRFFDDHLDSALRGGVRQIVTLAAGLDGRPVRLDCPPGTHWYELDLVGWLGGHGWSAEVHAGSDPAIGHGRAVSTSPAGWLGHAVLP